MSSISQETVAILHLEDFGVMSNETNVFATLKKMLNPPLIGVSCSAHVLNNCIHHEAEKMNIDIENNINKISQNFFLFAQLKLNN